jgi:hypothetical protein
MTRNLYPNPDSDVFKIVLDAYQNGRRTDVTGWSKTTLSAWLAGKTRSFELSTQMFGLDDFSASRQ